VEGYQKNIIQNLLSLPDGFQSVIVVDDDVDCHSAEDIIWAITTRCNPGSGIYRTIGDYKIQGNPIEFLSDPPGHQGTLGLDATVPFDKKWAFKQGHYPIEKVDLRDYLSDEEIAKAKSMQSEYSKVIAKRGS
jgi:3-polyprenyl-4-hydroxybenzoate decarboxylase